MRRCVPGAGLLVVLADGFSPSFLGAGFGEADFGDAGFGRGLLGRGLLGRGLFDGCGFAGRHAPECDRKRGGCSPRAQSTGTRLQKPLMKARLRCSRDRAFHATAVSFAGGSDHYRPIRPRVGPGLTSLAPAADPRLGAAAGAPRIPRAKRKISSRWRLAWKSWRNTAAITWASSST